MTCNLENDKLDSEEFKRIEQQCKIQKHIDINEDLMKLIEDDQEIEIHKPVEKNTSGK